MKLLALGTLFLATGSATVCGSPGYDNSGHDSASLPAYTVDTNASTPQLCYALCKSDSTCQSFAIGKGSCLLYAAPTENNFSPHDPKDFSPTRSPYYFYDISCDVTSSSPPTAHSSPICLVQGYDRGNPRTGSYDVGHTTPEQCAAVCRSQPGCTAYVLVDNFVTRRGVGCFYSTSLVDNFDASPVKDTADGHNYYFTELSCPGV
jgi:hypothetical protein